MKSIYVTIPLIMLLAGALIYSMGSVKPQKETMVVMLKENPEIVNEEEGTVLIQFQANEDDMDVADPPRKIQLYKSRKTGLWVGYDPDDKVLEGGLTVLSAAEVVLLDGRLHHIGYTFKRGDLQRLFLDGKVLDDGAYEPLKFGATGFAVKPLSESVGADRGSIAPVIYTNAMTIEEMRAISEK